MSWFKLTDEERKEWRDNPTTKAFFEEIVFQAAEASKEVVGCMLDEDEAMSLRARRLAGRVDGFETAVKIMERDS